jgi:hypothetical protein
MAGKAKSVYLQVVPKGELISVFKKVFFDAKGYKDFVKTDEFKEKYLTDQYQIIKEVY